MAHFGEFSTSEELLIDLPLLQLQATFTATGGRQAHYQFSPKCIMKLLHDLVFYPSSDFNEVCIFFLTS